MISKSKKAGKKISRITSKKTHKNQIQLIPISKIARPNLVNLLKILNDDDSKKYFGSIMTYHDLDKIIKKQINNKKSHNKFYEFAILNNHQIVGYLDLAKKDFNFHTKNYNICIRFYLSSKNMTSNFITKLKLLLDKYHIDKNKIWIQILNDDLATIPVILNNGFLFTKKDGNKNIYINDFRILKKIKKTSKIQDHNKNIKIITSGPAKGYENTFILSLNTQNPELVTDYLKNHLLNQNLIQVTSPSRKPAFLYLEEQVKNKYDTRYYDTECLVMNIVSKAKQVITNKYWLYLNFHKLFPEKCNQYMAKTFELTDFDKNLVLEKKQVYIIRPVGKGGWGGENIIIASDKKSLEEAYGMLGRFENVIASEYITNPILFEGKKCHLRCFFLVSNINNKFHTYFFDFYRIYTAKLPFINGDYGNPKIHDTHLKSTDRNVFGPRDITDPELKEKLEKVVYPKILDCMWHVSKILEGNCIPYSNSKNAFEIFGVDIMVRDNWDIVLLEINEHTGLGLKPEPEKIDDFSREYFDRINELVILPCLTGKYTGKYPFTYYKP